MREKEQRRNGRETKELVREKEFQNKLTSHIDVNKFTPI